MSTRTRKIQVAQKKAHKIAVKQAARKRQKAAKAERKATAK